MIKCPQNKSQFDTQEKCERWIRTWNTTKRETMESTVLHSAYLCKYCFKWHATSQEDVGVDMVVKLLFDQKEYIKYLCKLLNDESCNLYKNELRKRYVVAINLNKKTLGSLIKQKKAT